MNRLLFIEDDDEIRLAIRMALEDEGYQVDEARDGRTGLVLFDRHEPDLVLLDLRLPDMVGFDVCRTIRSRSIVPIVIVTAQMDTVDLVAGLEAGADDYVTKPVVIKELAARIRALLRRVHLQESAPPKPVIFGDIEIRREQGVVLKARRQELGPEAFRGIDLPRAATLLAQAGGRLIRTTTDRGVFAVLDPRLARAGYRWDIVRALPPMRRTRHREEAEAFLREITS